MAGRLTGPARRPLWIAVRKSLWSASPSWLSRSRSLQQNRCGLGRRNFPTTRWQGASQGLRQENQTILKRNKKETKSNPFRFSSSSPSPPITSNVAIRSRSIRRSIRTTRTFGIVAAWFASWARVPEFHNNKMAGRLTGPARRPLRNALRRNLTKGNPGIGTTFAKEMPKPLVRLAILAQQVKEPIGEKKNSFCWSDIQLVWDPVALKFNTLENQLVWKPIGLTFNWFEIQLVWGSGQIGLRFNWFGVQLRWDSTDFRFNW